MKCSRIKEKLTEYAYGDLSDKVASVVESHIKNCASCRQDYREINTVLSAALHYEDVDPPKEVYRALKKEVQAVFHSRLSRFSILWRPASAYVAVAAIALFAVVSGIGTRMEVARLERMNSLLSDSLRILNARSFHTPTSQLSDSSDSFLTSPKAETTFGD